MWQTNGIAKNFIEPIIAAYSPQKKIRDWIKGNTIKDLDHCNGRSLFAGISSKNVIYTTVPVIYNVPREAIDELHEGDILYMDSSGVIRRVWDIKSHQNVLFVTECCDSHCIMCPQPQKPIKHSQEIFKILSHIPKKSMREICISGGEPTTNDDLLEILFKLKKFPYVQPIILTNGRHFCDIEFAKKIVEMSPYNMVYAIPLYSSVSYIHDKIVGVNGAFEETIRGIYNLTKLRVPVEIRIVLMKQTIFSLTELANYIGWNLPMTVHVAFMGMEVQGRADENQNLVWIEPSEYMNELSFAITVLNNRNINISIYNLPLCLLPNKLWKYSCRSISDWKQTYLSECERCTKQKECGGFFTTSKVIPKGIHPIN